MKLINFYKFKQLSNLLDQMGAELIEMKSNNVWDGIDDEKLRELLNTGEVEIDISEIEIIDGVFNYKGKNVIAYIRDQYEKYYHYGYKFHLTNCDTIQKALLYKRKSRYVASLRTDGYFKINLVNDNIIVQSDLIEPLNVCKNCLTKISYKGYSSQTYTSKKNIYESFELEEYFNHYQKTNLELFGFRDANVAPVNIYNEDFDKRSSQFRKLKSYTCSSCKINLSNYPKFLHTHHIDGDKSNDSIYNLEALCIECHSRKPQHSRLRYNPDYFEFMSLKDKIKNENKNIT